MTSFMHLQRALRMAERYATATGKPHIIINVNRYSPVYIVREYDGNLTPDIVSIVPLGRSER